MAKLKINFVFEDKESSEQFQRWALKNPDCQEEELLHVAISHGAKQAILGDGSVWHLPVIAQQ